MLDALIERLNAVEIALRDNRPYAAVVIGEAADRIEADASTIASLRDANKALTAERDDLAIRAATIDEALTNAIHLRKAAEADKARLSEALRKAHEGLVAGCQQYAARTEFGSEVPGDEQLPWVRLMQIGRDTARAALSGNGAGWRVPDGWKLVPVEPDNAMIDAGAEDVPVYVKRGTRRIIAIDTYRAMIAASPAAPQQWGE